MIGFLLWIYLKYDMKPLKIESKKKFISITFKCMLLLLGIKRRDKYGECKQHYLYVDAKNIKRI